MKNKKYPFYNTPDLKNMQDLISYCFFTYGDKTAFSFLKKNVEINKSYKTFFEDVAALCCYFIQSGFKRTHIALLGENSYEWIVSYFAVVNSNNVVVPLDKEMSVAELSSIVKKSDSVVLIHSEDYEDEASALEGIQLINMNCFDEINNRFKTDDCSVSSFYDRIDIENDEMCTIVYTSGTTSEPKGVMLSHKNIVSDTIATSKSVKVLDPSLLTLPLHHTYGFVASVTIPMLIGSSIFINSSTRNLLRDIEFCKPEYIAVVPMMAEFIYKQIWENAKSSGKEKLLKTLINISDALFKVGIDIRRKIFSSVIDNLGGQLRIIVIGGAPIDPECVKGFYSFGIKALGGYGITECSPVVSTVRNNHYCPESVGTVHPGVNARIVNGEIQVKGDTVFLGYYKNPVETEMAFDEEWFKTGDIGKIKDGFLYVTGRIKNLIILSNGKNVSPEEMEYKLKSNIPEIKEIVVYDNDGALVAEIFSGDSDDESMKQTERSVFEYNKNLPVYKQISKVIFRDTEFPKTSSKKIKRKQEK